MNHPTANYSESYKTTGNFLVKDNYKSPYTFFSPHIFTKNIPVLKMLFKLVKKKQQQNKNLNI